MQRYANGAWRAAMVFQLLVAFTATAQQIDIHGPNGSGSFGTSVTVLPNGNIVVTDPAYSTPSASDLGAVYLYSPRGQLISTLTGSTANDRVGVPFDSVDGVTGNAETGIVVLRNGNYLILSPWWNAGSASNAGAVTFANAVNGVSGVVSADNSLIGSAAHNYVGYSVTTLSNGNYVVLSSTFNQNNTVNFATWGDGTDGLRGIVSPSNSLTSIAAAGQSVQVTALSNGNYVVASPNWSNDSNSDVGAVTWCDGVAGTTGTVSSSNSMIGSTNLDSVGILGVTPLANGNYVIDSYGWSNGSVPLAGAVTWGNGDGGSVGVVSEKNSLVGSIAYDGVGSRGVIPLTNGNYVVASPSWHGKLGASTWGNGAGGTAGVVSTDNSLVGVGPLNNDSVDDVAPYFTVALANGNYVVSIPCWNNGAATCAGAVTWGNGASGEIGLVSSGNSLIGTLTNDYVGIGITALRNGNYAVASSYWNSEEIPAVGAVTWGNGTTGTIGEVSSSNSLVGTSANDNLGKVVALSNGNYVVSSPYWKNTDGNSVGAATWGDGVVGTAGTVSAENSLIGTLTNDKVGYAITPLSDGNYVVASPFWNAPDAVSVGALTWGDGAARTIGMVSTENSLTGSTAGDQIGKYLKSIADGTNYGYGAIAVTNGNYIVRSSLWHNDGLPAAGAITLVNGKEPFSGTIGAMNSVLGAVANSGTTMVCDYDSTREHLIVGRPLENIVTLFSSDPIFKNGFE